MGMPNEKVWDYSTIIELKRDIANDLLNNLRNAIEDAFCNRAGTARNTSKEARRFEFSGGEDKFGCLQLGLLKLNTDQQFLNSVKTWEWVDKDPSECCDVLKEFSVSAR